LGAPAVTTLYDALSRPLTVTDAGGGTISYSYSKNDALVIIGPAPTGEQTKQRQLEYDALGRVTSVCEVTAGTTAWPGGTCAQTTSQTGYWTKYTYDALGNLLTVTQNAQSSSNQQTRSYIFDAMSRLTSETNPENGTTSYSYDSASGCTGTYNGDLMKKVDAVGNVTCFTYDALHRELSATYPSGAYAGVTPSKYFVYDSATVNGAAMINVKDHLAEAYTCTTCPGTKLTDVGYSYTVRGEVSDVYECTQHSAGYYHLTQGYWAHGAPNALSGLPGLPTIAYGGTIGSTVGLDGEGRITQVTAGSGQNPTTGVTYNQASLPSQVNFGSGDNDIFAYDPNTLRMTQFKFNVGTQSKYYNGALTWNANASLSQLAITDQFNSADTQTCNYSHDDLTRIATANCGSAANQSFSYDPFGNISKSGSPYTFQPTYTSNSPTNRFSSIPGCSSLLYDNDGNVLNDCNHSYTWDADGNSISIDTAGLTFDAFDRAVEKNVSGTYTQIVYGPGGDKLALMSGSSLTKAFIPLPGQATAVYNGSGLDHYRHSDWLGSARLTSSPTQSTGFLSSGAYAPFGETYASSGTTDVSFTGQNPDTVSLDYDFLFRPYSTQGRWPTPDPAGLSAADPTNPQSWNRYAYVLNNPLRAIDPFGLDCVWVNSADDSFVSVQLGDGDCSDHDGLTGFYVEGTVDQGSLGITNNGDIYGNLSNGTPFCSGSSCDNFDSVTVNGDTSMQVLYMVYTANGTISHEQACYEKVHNSTSGKVVKFFSLLSYTPASGDSKSAWVETGEYGTIKVAGLEGMMKLGEWLKDSNSATAQVIGTSLHGIAEGLEMAGKVAGPILTAAATTVDAPVVGACATVGYIQQLADQPWWLNQ